MANFTENILIYSFTLSFPAHIFIYKCTVNIKLDSLFKILFLHLSRALHRLLVWKHEIFLNENSIFH